MMHVVVGSTNPVKISATEEAFKKIFPERSITVVGVKVSSGVPDMPMTTTDTIRGAVTRAKNALAADEMAEFGVGIEGGLEVIEPHGWFLRAWVVLIEKSSQQQYLGSTFAMRLPDPLIRYMQKNDVDLARAIDEILQKKNVGRTTGVYGLLTNCLVDRRGAFVDAIVSAAWPLLTPRVNQRLQNIDS